MTTFTVAAMLGGWGNHFNQSSRITLCLMDTTLPPSVALCCFDPARFVRNVLLHSLRFGTLNLCVVLPKVLHLFSFINSADKNIKSWCFEMFSIQTMTHEIGHMFGIRHCQWLNCVMQGSNHLEESDRRPLDFCPICLHKLHTAIGFKIAERYQVCTLLHTESNFLWHAHAYKEGCSF